MIEVLEKTVTINWGSTLESASVTRSRDPRAEGELSEGDLRERKPVSSIDNEEIENRIDSDASSAVARTFNDISRTMHDTIKDYLIFLEKDKEQNANARKKSDKRVEIEKNVPVNNNNNKRARERERKMRSKKKMKPQAPKKRKSKGTKRKKEEGEKKKQNKKTKRWWHRLRCLLTRVPKENLPRKDLCFW